MAMSCADFSDREYTATSFKFGEERIAGYQDISFRLKLPKRID